MGSSPSKIEDDNALLLCQYRKRFVREALDGRCSLAGAHFQYIQSLKSIGQALRKFSELEFTSDSSLYSSNSVRQEWEGKSTSPFSSSSPHISNNTTKNYPPSSILPSQKFYVHAMKFTKSTTSVVEELPVQLTAKLQAPSASSRGTAPEPNDHTTFEAPPSPSQGGPWDYFDLFHPAENQYSFEVRKSIGSDFENVEVTKRFSNEEASPELEEERITFSPKGRDDSEDEFDKPSTEPLVRIFKNRNVFDNQEHELVDIPPLEYFESENELENDEKTDEHTEESEAEGAPVMLPQKEIVSEFSFPIDENPQESLYDVKVLARDFPTCMRVVEDLFIKASESGKELPRMLDADKVQVHPVYQEDLAVSKQISLFTTIFSCCLEGGHHSQGPAMTEIKYLTWHRSMSSQTSSSKDPLTAASKNEVHDLTGNIFSGIYMNSGSHASTLDRLHAWERKLYDEVKASTSIRNKYDLNCRLLRRQESREEQRHVIDKTRAVVKDLHSRIHVAIHRIDSISKKIEELRDTELQPQLEELIEGLTRMWTVMLDSHRQQYEIVSHVSQTVNLKIPVQSESHHQATLVLAGQLNELDTTFTKWMALHKSYLQKINSWLHKCYIPLKQQKVSKRRPVENSVRCHLAPPIYAICEDWIKLLDEIPRKEVSDAIKEFATATYRLLPRQEKRKIDLKLGLSSVQRGEMGEQMSTVNLVDTTNCSSFTASLVHFLQQLMKLAESSLEKYESLQKNINDVKVAYEIGARR